MFVIFIKPNTTWWVSKATFIQYLSGICYMPGTVPDQCVSETTKVFAFVVLKRYKLGEGRTDNTE